MSPDDPAVAASRLIGQWFHSHEEDSPGVEIYRPSSFDFPRARMPRDSVTFSPDGGAAVGAPGPADRAHHTPGQWSLVDDQVVVEADDGARLRFTLEADRAAPRLRATPPEGQDDDHHG